MGFKRPRVRISPLRPISLDFSSKNQGFFIFIAKQKSAALNGRPKQCYNQSIAAGFYRLLALLIGTTVIAVMVVHFLLQVFQRFPQHIGHDASAGYHEQKVRHGFHPPSGQIPGWNGVKPAATQWPTVSRQQGRLNHIRQLASRRKQPPLTSGREDAGYLQGGLFYRLLFWPSV